MWSKKRQTVGFTPRKLMRPSCIMKRRPSTINQKASSNIQVVVRVRPHNRRDSECRQVVKVVDDNRLVFDPKEQEEAFYVGGHRQLNRDMLKRRCKNQEMEFDRVFDETASNSEVFEGSTLSLVTSLLEGYNCSVFVYGATGAGKTYTMLGSKDTPGIAYLTMVELYSQMSLLENDFSVDIKVSYLEVYNEMVKDLINPSGPLSLRDDGRNGIIVSGIQTREISSAEELFNLLEYGNRNRTQHPTDANAESSRSHAVFQVYVRMTDKLSTQVKMAKLTMVDLAGSERGAVTGGKGLRFSEGSNINKSLLALGNCVDALAEGQKHIPYRNSKLTRILKDSLGGNCKTVMIVNVSPSPVCYEETFNTLHYASRAKKINNKVRKNLVSNEMPISQYKKIIEDLRKRIDELETELRSQPHTTDLAPPPLESEDIIHARNVLRTGYDEEAVYYKELHLYRCKIRTLEFRIHNKQAVRGMKLLVHHGRKELEGNLARTDKSMERFSMQIQSFKEKVKMIKSRIKEKQKMRRSAFQALEKDGLLKELQRDIDQNTNMMKQVELQYRIEYFKGILKMQENEGRSKNKIITTLTKTVDFYYSLLVGYNCVTEEMENNHMQLINHLFGVKEVTWEDNPGNYSMLQKLLDLSFSSDSDWGSPGNSGLQPATPCPAAAAEPATAPLATGLATPNNLSFQSEADTGTYALTPGIPATPTNLTFEAEAGDHMYVTTPAISPVLDNMFVAGVVDSVLQPMISPILKDSEYEAEADSEDNDDVCITLPSLAATLGKGKVEAHADREICGATSSISVTQCNPVVEPADKELCIAPASISAPANSLALKARTDAESVDASCSSLCPVWESVALQPPNPHLERTFVVDFQLPSSETSTDITHTTLPVKVAWVKACPVNAPENLKEKSFIPVPSLERMVSSASLNETFTATDTPRVETTHPPSQPEFLAPLLSNSTSKVISGPRCIAGAGPQKIRKIRLVPPPHFNKENVHRASGMPGSRVQKKHLVETSNISKEGISARGGVCFSPINYGTKMKAHIPGRGKSGQAAWANSSNSSTSSSACRSRFQPLANHGARMWNKPYPPSGYRKKSPTDNLQNMKEFSRGNKLISKPVAMKTTMDRIAPFVVNPGGVSG